MGCLIAVTIRKEDGSEYRMSRGTKLLPQFLTNVLLAEKNPAHIKQYVQFWQDVKTDWEQHYLDRKFSITLTPLHAKYELLAPYETGLIVVDLKTNHILNYQYYYPIDTLRLDINPDRTPKMTEEFTRLRGFFDKQRIKRAYDLQSHEVNINSIDMNSLLHITCMTTLMFQVDMSPFTVIDYDFYNSRSAEKLRKKLAELEFKLNEKEGAAWEQWTEGL